MKTHITITICALIILVGCKKPEPATIELGKEAPETGAAQKEAPMTEEEAPAEAEAPAELGLMMVLEAPPGGADIPAPPDVAAPPENAEKTDSGLASLVLKEGKGTHHPTKTDQVTVNYSGWTTDGKMFDSSVKKRKTATFPLNKVIPGWTEGVQLMVEGEIRRFWIPEELAYAGRPDRPQGMLIFDVQLLEIVN
jgi:peptidylprolyl isomerase